jgi:dienelactone hydrolase
VASRPAGFPGPEHLAGLSRSSQQADALAVAVHLRDPAGGAVSEVVALGFCMGGRVAFLLSAPAFGFNGVVGFYGAPGRVGPYGAGPTEHAAELGAPILGLFGGADEGIPPRAVADFDAALTAAVQTMRQARKTAITLGFDTQSERADAILPKIVELVKLNACFAVKSWRSNDGFLGDGSFQAGIRAAELRMGKDFPAPTL